MLRLLARVFSEPVMGLLALLALVPLLFDFTPRVDALLDNAEWILVACFAAEYLTHLALARDKRRFALDPWRIFDLLVILAPLASLIPGISDAARSSLALRLVRLVRVVLFGARAGTSLQRQQRKAAPESAGPPRVSLLRPGSHAAQHVDWHHLLQWAANPTSDWFHASNIEPTRFEELARAAGVPQPLVDASLGDAAYPRLETLQRWSVLSCSLPDPDGAVRRIPFLLLVTGDDLLSLSRHPADLHAAVAAAGPVAGMPDSLPWGLQGALLFLKVVLSRYEELAGNLEREVRSIEEVQASENSQAFFERTFGLKKDLSAAKADLFRLRTLLASLADGRRSLPGLAPEHRPLIAPLAEEADVLHETIDTIREGLLSLIDLHLNVAAHETNRFMRLLAIVSVLALIPSLAGGLLGMNLRDSPWPFTLGQVTFGTFFLMVLVLYAFLAKGWLR
ncbi:MAG TPA: CorA family divalent cation transporter [Polyangia bacterium]|nr:CorA family divalent cation transporter [Polyangia bacterium]